MGLKFNTLKVKSQKNNGTYIFSNFDIGLYLLDTPRSLGEQLGSLGLIGGRNIITEKSALVPQYGYQVLGQLPAINDVQEYVAAVSKDSASTSSFFIVSQTGKVYLYTAAQGLKKYATEIGVPQGIIVTHSGKHLVVYNGGQLYLFGGYYEEATVESLADNVSLSDYTSYYQFSRPLSEKDYYWNGKDLAVTGTVGGESNTSRHVVISVTEDEDNDVCIVKTVIEGTHLVYENQGIVSIGEKALIEKDCIYTPEEGEEITMTPRLMEVCVNRLFIVDVSGRIYYSQIGGVEIMANSLDPENVTGFKEAYGAGYFEGFYNSTSLTLAIEDFLNGALITKEDGLYYLVLTQQTQDNTGTVTDRNTTNVYINKIANIGQKYATDHVIVREQVFAYDTWSGNIVDAASVNVFGNLVAGGIIIDQKALASYSSGIDSTKRSLCYNGQENKFFLYYGENLDNGILLTTQATIFPRKLDVEVMKYIGFNQGVVGVTPEGLIIQDYKPGTVIPNISAYADFEAIGLRDNRFTCSSLIEVTELNGVNYSISTKNAGGSYQYIRPNINIGINNSQLPPLIYSDKRFNIFNDSFQLTSRWADKKSNVTRIYAPMSGREGVQISIEFDKNTSFCLAALRLPDFSQGE